MQKLVTQRRRIACLLLVIFMFQLAYPVTAWALTGGPAQPEFSGFEPVSANEMVNKFTGDFAYTLPVMEVPGPQGSSYPLTLAYHSGSSVEDEASWVGYGWSLSPGAINRSARGIPDDFQGEKTTYYNRMPDNYTLTSTVSGNLQGFSIKSLPKVTGSASLNYSIRYNNQSGFGTTLGLGVGLMDGLVSLGMQTTNAGERSFSAQINPMAYVLSKHSKEGTSAPTVKKCIIKSIVKTLSKGNSLSVLGGGRGMLDYNESRQPTYVPHYDGTAYTFGVDLSTNIGVVAPVHLTVGGSGTYAKQTTRPAESLTEYGYLYAGDGYKNRVGGNDLVSADFYTEKESPYQVRNTFLGIPFHNADYYNVSGEGLGGIFQVYHPKVGEFVPNKQSNRTEIFNLGVDIALGNTFGVGGTFDVGSQTLTDDIWNTSENNFSFSTTQDPLGQRPYFRFVNDLGGQIGPKTDEAVSAVIKKSNSLGNYSLDEQTVNAIRQQDLTANSTMGRGSFIGQHSYEEIGKGELFRYCKRKDIADLRYQPVSNANASASVQKPALAEFQIVNENGQQYTYGLPVYARREKSMQYGLTDKVEVASNYLAYLEQGASADEFFKNTPVAVGDYRESPYATNYLLTEITTPDFIDRNFNGPDATDFGGYTTFHYKRAQGGSSDAWYRWRVPYQGMIHNRGSLSNREDDTGSISQGEKEIFYLSAVRTKTHTAVFITEERKDGFDAAVDNDAIYNKQLDQSKLHKLQVLKEIRLYANEDLTWQNNNYSTNATPLKTVSFDYDYSLCQNTTNAVSGKLTLLRVHTFYNGIEQGKPYEFNYSYPDASVYPESYQAFNMHNSVINENPNYEKFSLDAWGNYQSNGKKRQENLQTWPSQDPDDQENFDPAAWQLKVIKLPSGGELHVQYEQKDYLYVQDKLVHGLVPLIAAPADNEFILDFSSITGSGITADKREKLVEACRQEIENRYVRGGDKLYFRFLYSLLGNNASITSCNAEYITGYAPVDKVETVTIDGVANLKIYIKKPTDGQNTVVGKSYTLPKEVCINFVKTQRLGKLSDTGNCTNESTEFNIQNKGEAEKVIRQYFAWVTTSAKQMLFGPREDYCVKMTESLSYFKIPLPQGKKGGGVRVKRLLTFDSGSLTGTATLYGQEFSYQLPNGLSSGVATTEPTTMRQENALIHIIPRLRQSFGSKIIAGVDREQTEGPIGESLLPGASIGYSRVVTTNIHKGVTNSGMTETQYYTCKDFPMRSLMTPLQTEKYRLNILTGIYNKYIHDVWASQGFSVILNNMHGQLRREATYSLPVKTNAGQAAKLPTPIQEVIYEYVNPSSGSEVLMQSKPSFTATDQADKAFPGKEVEVVVAKRHVEDATENKALQVDASFTSPFMFPWLTAAPYYNGANSSFYSHTTSKIVRYPAIVKRVITRHDGIEDITENLAFDRYTGRPVATRTADRGKGGYVQQQVMAPWLYEQLRSKAFSEGQLLTQKDQAGNAQVFANILVEQGELYLVPTDQAKCDLFTQIHSGDVLAINDYTGNVYHAEAPDVVRRRIRLYPVKPAAVTSESLQAAAINECRQIRTLFSGFTNELSTAVGSTTIHLAELDRSKATLPTIGANNGALAAALQTALKGKLGRVEVKGPFDNINVSGFRAHIPASIPLNDDGEQIKNLMFEVFQDKITHEKRIKLLSFVIIKRKGTSTTEITVE